jgi:hypothetical protein
METWEIVVAVLIALEAFIGALPNNWIPYRSFILRFFKFLEESEFKAKK